jgi:hypothetical protein
LANQQRVTLYHDPLNDQNWIVASDFGDPSDEQVLSKHENYDVAVAAAEAAAADRECGWAEEKVTLL